MASACPTLESSIPQHADRRLRQPGLGVGLEVGAPLVVVDLLLLGKGQLPRFIADPVISLRVVVLKQHKTPDFSGVSVVRSEELESPTF